MNAELQLFGVMRGAQPVDYREIVRLKSQREAIAYCISIRRIKYSMNEIAARICIDKGQWSKIRKGSMHLPSEVRTKLQQLCGNYAISQFEMYELGIDPQLFESFLRLHANGHTQFT